MIASKKEPMFKRILLLPLFLVGVTVYIIWCLIEAVDDWLHYR